MKRQIAALLLSTLALLFMGCTPMPIHEDWEEVSIAEATAPPETALLTEAPAEPLTETPAEEEEAPEETAAPAPAETSAQTEPLPPEDEPLPASVEKDGSYTSPEDVAAYIHTFGTLPANFITKKEAQKLGWNSSEGNLWDVAPGMSIGGDYFGNREGLLPEGDYRECDVNYAGGFRGAERLIYGADGSIFYTNDHYKSFTQLY